MKPKEFLVKFRAWLHVAAIVLSSLFPFVTPMTAKAEKTKSKKSLRSEHHTRSRSKHLAGSHVRPRTHHTIGEHRLNHHIARHATHTTSALPEINPLTAKAAEPKPIPSLFQAIFGGFGKLSQAEHYPWKTHIVTTVFWVGESATARNPVPNRSSAWDDHWASNYGGSDSPTSRHGYIPASFKPHQNPFYVALPYNDILHGHLKEEARRIIPWFQQTYHGDTKSVCKDRWIAIRYKGRVCYAQWEDAGPFRTDHAEYVFGNARPKPNINRGAGLDVSPAVRDYLHLDDTSVTDWRFVDFSEIPHGPWALYGNNNTFVQNARKSHTFNE